MGDRPNRSSAGQVRSAASRPLRRSHLGERVLVVERGQLCVDPRTLCATDPRPPFRCTALGGFRRVPLPHSRILSALRRHRSASAILPLSSCRVLRASLRTLRTPPAHNAPWPPPWHGASDRGHSDRDRNRSVHHRGSTSHRAGHRSREAPHTPTARRGSPTGHRTAPPRGTVNRRGGTTAQRTSPSRRTAAHQRSARSSHASPVHRGRGAGSTPAASRGGGTHRGAGTARTRQ